MDFKFNKKVINQLNQDGVIITGLKVIKEFFYPIIFSIEFFPPCKKKKKKKRKKKEETKHLIHSIYI
jgi:hypothetical protein